MTGSNAIPLNSLLLIIGQDINTGSSGGSAPLAIFIAYDSIYRHSELSNTSGISFGNSSNGSYIKFSRLVGSHNVQINIYKIIF